MDGTYLGLCLIHRTLLSLLSIMRLLEVRGETDSLHDIWIPHSSELRRVHTIHCPHRYALGHVAVHPLCAHSLHLLLLLLLLHHPVLLNLRHELRIIGHWTQIMSAPPRVERQHHKHRRGRIRDETYCWPSAAAAAETWQD